MRHCWCHAASAAVVVSVAVTLPAQAGVIDGGRLVDSLGIGPSSEQFPAPNTGVPASLNVLEGVRGDSADSHGYGVQLAWDAVGPLIVEFDVSDSGQPSDAVEYAFSTQVNNLTGIDWEGMVVELGRVDSSGDFVAGAFDGLDFDSSPLDESGPEVPIYLLVIPTFAPPTYGPQDPQFVGLDRIEIDATANFDDRFWSGAFLDHTIAFNVDVPNNPGFAEWQNNSGGYSFAVRYTPQVVVPEPSSAIALLGLALASLARRRR